jgi:hypothetical protein
MAKPIRLRRFAGGSVPNLEEARRSKNSDLFNRTRVESFAQRLLWVQCQTLGRFIDISLCPA